MDKRRYAEHSKGYVLFPVVDIASERIIKLIKEGGGSIVRKKSRKTSRRLSYMERLREKLDEGELRALVRGYDLFGNIALIELPQTLRKKRRAIASAIISANRNVETVLEKAGPVSGAYRTRKLRYIAGKRSFMADYLENGCRFIFDVRKVFFSNRLSYERARISSLVGEREKVVVLFAGVGPFAIEIAKAHKDSKVIGVELNGVAYNYMRRNMELNGLHNAEAVRGDVRKVYKKYLNYADRIIMPLPAGSAGFMREATAIAKDHAVMHVYLFCGVGRAKEAFDEISGAASKLGYGLGLIGSRVVRPYSAREEEVVLDIGISRR